MKIGILTFHASHNYGSMLQAYALKHVLSKLGHECMIINFRTEIQKSLTPPPIELIHPRSAIRRLFCHPQKTINLLRKYNRFEYFLKHDLAVGPELHKVEDVETYVSDSGIDAIVTGSDQIWNPACWDFNSVYLIDFSFSGRRIAYAPSLGSHPEQISSEDKSKIANAIARYDYLSTREERGCQILSHITGKNIELVVDPTFLLDKIDYEEILNQERIVKEPYLFYYTPREESGFFNRALRYAYEVGIKILVTQDFHEYEGNGIIRILDCGPKEFLSIISNASVCIGNSFHLLAFSLIFNKEFYLLSNERDSRMINILSELDLENRLIVGDKCIFDASPIDYDVVGKKVKKLRLKSMEYLRSAVGNL